MTEAGLPFRATKDLDIVLYQIISRLAEPPPAQVRRDLSDFIASVKAEGVDLQALKVDGALPDVLDGLADAYHLL